MRSEVKESFTKLFEENGTQTLMDNANHYKLSDEQKEALMPKLEELARKDTHRSAKSRKKYIARASDSYKSAAKTLRTMKEAKSADKVITNGVKAIYSIFDAEKSLIKAGSVFDERETLRLKRNDMRRSDMLRRFYKKCLNREDLSEKQRTMLETKLDEERKRFGELQKEMVTATLTDMPPAADMAGNMVMNRAQFLALVNKINGKEIPPEMNTLAEMLDMYHNGGEEIGKEKAPLSKVMSQNAARALQVSEFCDSLAAKYSYNMRLVTALDILKNQMQKFIPTSYRRKCLQAIV